MFAYISSSALQDLICGVLSCCWWAELKN